VGFLAGRANAGHRRACEARVPAVRELTIGKLTISLPMARAIGKKVTWTHNLWPAPPCLPMATWSQPSANKP